MERALRQTSPGACPGRKGMFWNGAPGPPRFLSRPSKGQIWLLNGAWQSSHSVESPQEWHLFSKNGTSSPGCGIGARAGSRKGTPLG